jgi:hypothetical protein
MEGDPVTEDSWYLGKLKRVNLLFIEIGMNAVETTFQRVSCSSPTYINRMVKPKEITLR